MKRREVAEHERRIQGVFRRAWVDNGWSAATDDTPLDALMAEEYDPDDLDGEPMQGDYYWPSPEKPDLEITTLKRDEAARVAAWARRRLIMWIIGEGLHPFNLVQRIYALLYSRYQEFIGPLSNMTMLAEILDQGKSAFSAVVKRLFTRPVKIKSGVMMLSPGMKSEESRQAYADNASKNTPRREIDAVTLDEGVESESAKDEQAKRLETLKAAREAYERKRMADLVGCKPEEIDLSKININDQDDDGE